MELGSSSPSYRSTSVSLDDQDSFHDDGDCGGERADSSLFQFDWLPSNPLGGSNPVPSEAETQTEGQELYLHFFHEQLRSQGLGEVAAQEEAGFVIMSGCSFNHDTKIH